MLANFKNLSEADLDLVVLRYLTFPKFISMLTYQALWFSKLNILEDKFEGTLPHTAEAVMRTDNQKWKHVFDSLDYHQQLDQMSQRNVADGRELLVVNCWFLGPEESMRMWNEYAHIAEGVAIKSTLRKLAKHVFVWRKDSHIGRVRYVDYSQHTMSLYDGNQAHERAFLKAPQFSHEQEIRIVTMNFKDRYCISPEGRPYTQEECSGNNMNNLENPGLYRMINFKELVDSVIMCPEACPWIEKLVRRIFEMSRLDIPVLKSQLQHVKI